MKVLAETPKHSVYLITETALGQEETDALGAVAAKITLYNDMSLIFVATARKDNILMSMIDGVMVLNLASFRRNKIDLQRHLEYYFALPHGDKKKIASFVV